MLEIINNIFANFFNRVVEYLPNFFAGVIIICIGIVLAALVKKIFLVLFSLFKLPFLLERARLMKAHEVNVWQNVFAEVLRWTIIILFLVPTLEVLGLGRATAVIDQLLFYLPNVIVAVIIGFVGLVLANLMSDIVYNGLKKVKPSFAKTLAVMTKTVVLFFTILVVLNQLGVAQDLIRILFTGIVAMIALAGGLAFGLGGKDTAKDILNELKKRIT